MPSAALILAEYIKQVLVAHKDGFLLPVQSQRREIVENENLFYVSPEQVGMQMVYCNVGSYHPYELLWMHPIDCIP